MPKETPPMDQEPETSDFAEPHCPGPSTSTSQCHFSHAPEMAPRKIQSIVQIDRHQIQAVETEQQALELQGLGLAVYDQEVLERGILQQVDNAINDATRAARVSEAENEQQVLKDELSSCLTSLRQINNIIHQLSPHAATCKEVSRKLDSVKRQKHNKEQQVKKMKAKLRRLGAALGVAQEECDFEQLESEHVEDGALPTSLGSMLMPFQDDWENLIRTGQMTPFGTKIPPKEERKPRKLMLNETSDFEKYLADQAQMAAQRKHSFISKTGKKKRLKAESKKDGKALKPVNQSASVPSSEKRLRTKMRKLQSKALQTQFKMGIPCKKRDVLSTESIQEHDSEGSVYSPDEQELSMEEDEEDEKMHNSPNSDFELKPLQRKRVKKRSRHQGMDPEFLPSSDDDEETPCLLKGKRCRDDGDVKVYKHRIRLYQKQLAMEAHQQSESEDSDVEFDEGFCVPGSIWKKLYK